MMLGARAARGGTRGALDWPPQPSIAKTSSAANAAACAGLVRANVA
jgi:hypothetical protein